MPEENRVFDVTKPSQVNPSATSKPVIVGHQPMTNDPMVNGQGGSEPTRIPVSDGFSAQPNPTDVTPTSSQSFEAPEAFSAPAESSAMPSVDNYPGLPTDPLPETAAPAAPAAPIEGLRMAKPKRRKWPKLAVLVLILLVAAYLLADAGVIRGASHLPFHIFKQTQNNTTPASSTPPPASNSSNAPVVPSGFKEYKLANTPVVFAAPISWGDPTSAPEPGYSKRGGSNQSDGTYAYLVNFATNKDVQIAVTSSKFLPASVRTPLYYDYLQWCVGSNDGQVYESILHYSTTDKVDTPTTVTCDQGPVASAVKLDSSTILQAKAQDTNNKIVGDIYTKNLTDPSLVVFRVKDAAMTNGDNIKQLLNTIQLTSTSSSSQQ